MKKTFLAIIIAAALSAGLTSKTSAQTTAVGIENFNTGNVKTSAVITETPVYNKAGELQYSVKRYEESALPAEISKMVRNQFTNFDIIGVEEVVIPSDNNSVYFVHIANNKKLETVKIYNDDFEVINEFKKG